MRAVLDTNVLVSAAIRPRSQIAGLIRYLIAEAYTLLYSEPLLNELISVLGRPRFRRDLQIYGELLLFVSVIQAHGELVTPTRRIAVCRDPDDDRVLEAAVDGRADLIVTGDRDLLDLGSFEGVRIVPPADFLTMLAARSEGE